MAENKPLLSIGMIFKNEIRCLERCLQSLQPLREAVPCELVLADTGSEDGSREVAAKYADILFDFPWVNDFSAARNAVMDRCSGKWYLTIDADEWLENIDELVQFLRSANSRKAVRAGQGIEEAFVIQRNYESYSTVFRDRYMDLFVPRILLMSTGIRYSGAIHEIWRFPQKVRFTKLSQTVLHHDGYAGMNANDAAGQAKLERNMVLLRDELAQNPEDLRTLTECVDASTGEERWDYACRLVELVKQKKSGWWAEGPNSLGSAVNAAINLKKYDKMEEWIALAEEMFPQTFVVRLDMEIHGFQVSWNKKDYADCVRRGERFLEAYADYHAGRGDQYKNYCVSMAGPRWPSYIKIFLAYALCKEGEYQKSWDRLQNVEFAFLNEEETQFLVANLKDLQRLTDYDLEPILLRLWQTINQPDFARGEECRKGFTDESLWAFLASNLEKEQQGGVKRPAYTLFLALGEQNQLGIAAKLMEEKSLPELERLLGLVEDWETLPEMPLLRALAAGANFPVKPLTLAEMDRLAGRLAAESPQMAAEITVKAAEQILAADLQAIMWARGLALAAVQNCEWQEKQNFELAQAFAAVEQAFLAQYYTPELLCEENIGLLPPLHAFGWYCAWAFDELAKGNALEYVRLLRKGLDLCPDMKAMVNFLVENTPELQEKPAPSGELQALANQVRTILANYAPDDPAVLAIKNSEVYQKIAYLIEDGEDSEQ